MTNSVRNLGSRGALHRLLLATVAIAFLSAACGADDAEDLSADDVVEEATEAAEDVEENPEEAVDEAAEEVDEAAEDAAEEIDDRSPEIAQALRDNGLTSLASAVESVDATELLGNGAFTFFAPNDEAFLALGADQLADLLADPAQLSAILANHVVTDKVDSGTLTGMATVDTRGGNSLPVTVDGDVVMVGDATVVSADIEAADGVIHVIDSVLVP